MCGQTTLPVAAIFLSLLLNDIFCFQKVGELFYDLCNGASDRVFMKANNFFFTVKNV
jgi:hypothetical protein